MQYLELIEKQLNDRAGKESGNQDASNIDQALSQDRVNQQRNRYESEMQLPAISEANETIPDDEYGDEEDY